MSKKTTTSNESTPRWRRITVLLPSLLVLAVGVAGVSAIAVFVPVREDDAKATPRPPERVRVVEVQPVDQLADTLVLNGEVEPNAVVRIAAEVPGRIERLGTLAASPQDAGGEPIDEGDPIRAGQVLMELNKELIQTEYDQALAQWKFAKAEYERVSEVHRQGAASDLELDNARTTLLVAKANLNNAAARLERCTITATIGGVLNHLPVEVGEYVSPGQPVAELVDNSTAKIVVAVPERVVGSLRVGQEQEIFTMDEPPASITGRITFIGELADPAARTTPVEITVPNTFDGDEPASAARSWEGRRRFRSGQIVKVRLTQRVLQDVILIPLSAAIPTETGYVVYVVDPSSPADEPNAVERPTLADGVARRRSIEIGLIKGTQVQVTEGLLAGDLLVFDGHRKVGPGQSVRIVERAVGTVNPGASALDAWNVEFNTQLAPDGEDAP